MYSILVKLDFSISLLWSPIRNGRSKFNAFNLSAVSLFPRLFSPSNIYLPEQDVFDSSHLGVRSAGKEGCSIGADALLFRKVLPFLYCVFNRQKNQLSIQLRTFRMYPFCMTECRNIVSATFQGAYYIYDINLTYYTVCITLNVRFILENVVHIAII